MTYNFYSLHQNVINIILINAARLLCCLLAENAFIHSGSCYHRHTYGKDRHSSTLTHTHYKMADPAVIHCFISSVIWILLLLLLLLLYSPIRLFSLIPFLFIYSFGLGFHIIYSYTHKDLLVCWCCCTLFWRSMRPLKTNGGEAKVSWLLGKWPCSKSLNWAAELPPQFVKQFTVITKKQNVRGVSFGAS